MMSALRLKFNIVLMGDKSNMVKGEAMTSNNSVK